jgi:hypothetical protein
MNSTTEIARGHVGIVEEHADKVPTGAIVNSQEMRSQESEDRLPRAVTIPDQSRPICIEYSVPRAEKQIPCPAIFSDARDALIRALVIHRETIDNGVSEERWRDWQDFIIRSSNTFDFTGDILKEYLTRVFQSDVHSARQAVKLWNFPAVLTFDPVLRIPMMIPITNLFQSRDLVTLGVFKREKRDAIAKLDLRSLQAKFQKVSKG